MIWVALGVVGIVATIWFLYRADKPCTRHARKCPGCRKSIRIFHEGQMVVVGHEHPECHWFTQNMQKSGMKLVEEEVDE